MFHCGLSIELCPIMNFAKVQKALKEAGGELFPIPKRSADVNPINNIFNASERRSENTSDKIEFNIAKF